MSNQQAEELAQELRTIASRAAEKRAENDKPATFSAAEIIAAFVIGYAAAVILINNPV